LAAGGTHGRDSVSLGAGGLGGPEAAGPEGRGFAAGRSLSPAPAGPPLAIAPVSPSKAERVVGWLPVPEKRLAGSRRYHLPAGETPAARPSQAGRYQQPFPTGSLASGLFPASNSVFFSLRLHTWSGAGPGRTESPAGPGAAASCSRSLSGQVGHRQPGEQSVTLRLARAGARIGDPAGFAKRGDSFQSSDSSELSWSVISRRQPVEGHRLQSARRSAM